jgi:hypothetical protein
MHVARSLWWKKSLNHDLGLGRSGGRLGLVHVNIHFVALSSLTALFLLLELVLALALNIHTAVVGHLVFLATSLWLWLSALALDAVHGGVLISTFAVGANFGGLCLLLCQLLRAVLLLVGDEVGLGLLGGELSGS